MSQLEARAEVESGVGLQVFQRQPPLLLPSLLFQGVKPDVASNGVSVLAVHIDEDGDLTKMLATCKGL